MARSTTHTSKRPRSSSERRISDTHVSIAELGSEPESDGRPAHAQVKFYLNQLPAFLRHLPTYLAHRRIRHVNPKKHYVWLFDNIAFRAASVDQDQVQAAATLEDSMDSDNMLLDLLTAESDPWQVEYTAAFFKRTGARDLARSVYFLSKQLDVDRNRLSDERVKERIRHFVDPVLPNHAIHSSIGRGLRHLHGPSSASGLACMSGKLPSSTSRLGKVHNVFPGAHDARCFLPGVTTFAEPLGYGVISDIDDTIKVTLTPNTLGILHTTFLEEAQPVSGMPELYETLRNILSDPAFFYVSASPYNLYPYLRQFRQTYFPMGQIMLRESTWQNFAGLVGGLIEDVQKYKTERISKIHAWFPKRKFILIGDTTQKDPETYGSIARMYPDWVLGIFIRRVEGVSDIADPHQDEKNSACRLSEAFVGVDPAKWHCFDSPEEVRTVLDTMLA